MRELGIKPEHECFDAGHVANLDPLIDMGLLDEPLQISLVMGVNGGIRPTPANVAFMSEQIPGGAEGANNWQVIGVSRDQWKLLGAVARCSAATSAPGSRTTSTCPNGEMARSNGELIAKARQMAEDVGRRAATVAEAREMLGRAEARGLTASDERAAALATSGSSTSPGCCPGGFCSLLLADLGADVIKVEDTGMGDYVRWAPPYYGDDAQQALGTRSALYLSLNRGKRSIRLDLKSERRPRRVPAPGRATPTSSSRASARACSTGSASATSGCARRTRGIVYCAITGYGHDGPNTPAPATT